MTTSDLTESALELFHPTIRDWFSERFPGPTEIQKQAWPVIAEGGNALISAPTGSGKTLTAFLWAVNQLVTGKIKTGHTAILYISPLKALNNDIYNNLQQPLQELEERFLAAGIEFPDIRVSTRSGDTSAEERRQMTRQPPEILITTPESLNLLLSSQSGLTLLQGLQTVILDEIHSLIDNKRGAYLNLAVERLTLYSGEFQRIALSATINPMQAAADFVAGFALTQPAENNAENTTTSRYERREITTLQSSVDKSYDIQIRYPESLQQLSEDKKLWDALAEELLVRIEKNRSTLVFVNSRVLCEKITNRINSAADATVAYAHHGSLSKEIRKAVETKLKAGELAAIVATSSLEMGIDIGDLDEVLLIQTSGSIASAIQRVGRAGHQVGEVSRSTLFPTHPQDFLETAVLAKAITERDIEPVHAIENPLDVLCQEIISMVAMDTWDIDELYDFIRTAQVYQKLSRSLFDLCLTMLAGRYADNRIKELKPRISIDKMDNSLSIRPGALLTLYRSGGVIPDRGYYQLRHDDSNSKIGELDEEFVWEASIGQVFTLGTQHWKITRITHNDVFVVPSANNPILPPFWIAESINRNFHFSEKITQFLEFANNSDAKSFKQALLADYHMKEDAAEGLIDYLERQKEHTRANLPDRHHLVIEVIESFLGFTNANQVVLHTFWGACVNRPLALAFEAAWEEKYHEKIELYVSNEAIVIQLPEEVSPDLLLSLVNSSNLEERLRHRLEGSGFFGARFRECAGRALLLSKGKFNERRPLWMSRLQSQKLFDVVQRYQDFPILLETWRTCLQDEFDLFHLKQLLDEWHTGVITHEVVHTKTPSPMAQNIAWEQVNLYMYMDDNPQGSTASQLNQQLLNEILYNDQALPSIPLEIVERFQAKLKRLLPNYAPNSTQEWLDWLTDRNFIPWQEWQELIKTAEEVPDTKTLSTRAGTLKADKQFYVCPMDQLDLIQQGLVAENTKIYFSTLTNGLDQAEFKPKLPTQAVSEEEPTQNKTEALSSLLGNFLQFTGPITLAGINQQFLFSSETLLDCLNEKCANRELVVGQLIEGSEDYYYCDASHFESLLFITKSQASQQITAKPISELPSFLYQWQGEQHQPHENESEQLGNTISQLQGLCLTPKLWESEILPARLPNYRSSDLDQLLQTSDLQWFGTTEKKIGFCFHSDFDLLPMPNAEVNDAHLASCFEDPLVRYDFNALLAKSGLNSSELLNQLWQKVWTSSISNDSFAAVRRGINTKFKSDDSIQTAANKGRVSRRALKRGFQQWKRTLDYPGNWYQLSFPNPERDIIDQTELIKDKARQLFHRYGILFRELLLKEIPGFRWADIFKALRLMELSREIIGGYFFEDIPGLQFASQSAFRSFQRKTKKPSVFWLNAADPISLCGVPVPTLKGTLPKRIESNHLVYVGSELVLVSESHGKTLTFNIPVDHEEMPTILGFFRHLLYREANPLKQITIQTINGEPARQSEYLEPLKVAYDITQSPTEISILKSY